MRLTSAFPLSDRLLGNPWAEPPTSADWEIRPTYRSHTVPYFLAPMWDERQAQAKNLLAQQTKRAASLQASGGACVPRELKEKLKRSKGAKSLLQDLEEEVRKFVKSWEEKHEAPADDGLDDVHSSDEEEIVFVGRNGKMRDDKPRDSSKALEKLVFESPVSDQGAAFGYVSNEITMLHVSVADFVVVDAGLFTLLPLTMTSTRGQLRKGIQLDVRHMLVLPIST